MRWSLNESMRGMLLMNGFGKVESIKYCTSNRWSSTV
jgi:hypothetical protein